MRYLRAMSTDILCSSKVIRICIESERTKKQSGLREDELFICTLYSRKMEEWLLCLKSFVIMWINLASKNNTSLNYSALL